MSKKQILLVGSAAYLILGILAYLFYLERCMMLDISFQGFHILRADNFAIQVNRFGACFTQAFPLIASKLNFSLEAVMKCYSLAFVINYYIIFLLCLAFSKSKHFALIMLLYPVFIVTDTFYWVQSEFLQAMAHCILFFALIWGRNKFEMGYRMYWLIPFCAFMLFMLVFFHPLIIFPFFFMLGFFYLESEKSNKFLVALGVAFLAIYMFKYFFFKAAYDNSAMSRMGNFISYFPNYLNLPINKDFLSYLWKDYYLLPITLVAVSFFYLKQREWQKMTLVCFSLFAYLLLINVTNAHSPDQFYIESFYIPLSLMLIIPLVFDLTRLADKRTVLIGLLLVLTLRIMHIGFNHKVYSNRVDYIQELLDKAEEINQPKLVIPDQYIAMETMLMTWGSPTETWLLSTIRTGNSKSLLIVPEPEYYEFAAELNNAFVTLWGNYEYNNLPEQYFNFMDTAGYYFIKEDIF